MEKRRSGKQTEEKNKEEENTHTSQRGKTKVERVLFEMIRRQI